MALRPRGILSFAVRAARNAEARAAERAAAEAAERAAAEAAAQAAAKAGRTSLTVPRRKVQRRPAPTPPKVLALPPPGPGLPDFAVKPRGGQWWPDRQVDLGGYTGNFSPEASAREIFRVRFPDLNPEIEPETAALRTWFERALPRYIKNELGTPEDPLRGLAEQGLLHIPDLSPEGWSKGAAGAIIDEPIGNILFPTNPKGGMPGAGDDYRGGVLASMPWLAKAPVTDKLYSVTPDSLDQLGFSHVIDEMQQALHPEHFGLPPELAVRPESLDRMSLAAAVERAGKIGQWRNKQMELAALDDQNNPVTHIFKEYAENNPRGLRWVEMAPPKGDGPFNYDVEQELSKALKYEGDTMGHCVGGYCPDVMEGRSRIFSLRDAKGEPHVTIETQPGVAPANTSTWLRENQPHPDDLWRAYQDYAGLSFDEIRDLPGSKGFADYVGVYAPELATKYPEAFTPVDDIIQIKGKQNRAPKDDYLPFVRDFVQSGKWGHIGDEENSGLRRLHGELIPTEDYNQILKDANTWMTNSPGGQAIRKFYKTTMGGYGTDDYKAADSFINGDKVFLDKDANGKYTGVYSLNEIMNVLDDPGAWEPEIIDEALKGVDYLKANPIELPPYFDKYAAGGRVSSGDCSCNHPFSVR